MAYAVGCFRRIIYILSAADIVFSMSVCVRVCVSVHVRVKTWKTADKKLIGLCRLF